MVAISCISRILLTLLIFTKFGFISCWDNDDFEIFDLVEEVNANFYEIFNIDQSATTSEVKRAYRKLSLQYHPDKNDAADAEEKFRQIVAMYEVLKDEKKRERYNQVLVEGLPDWKQPVFYYRRARKLGLHELCIVLAIIITIGQYFVAWGIYVERRLVVEEILNTKKKKEKKKKKQLGADADIDDEEELKSIPTPRILDLWPFRLSVFIFYSVYNLPTTVKEWKEERKRRKEEEEELARALAEELENQPEEIQRKPKKKAPVQLPEYNKEMYAAVQPGGIGAFTQDDDDTDRQQMPSGSLKKGEWTDEELVLLSKAVNKFPGGTHQRWEKISEMVGRSTSEVIAKAKETKGNYLMNLSTDVQSSGYAKSIEHMVSDNKITQNTDDVDDSDSQLRKRKKTTKNTKTAERTLLIAQGANNSAESQPSKDNSESKPSEGGANIGEVVKGNWTQNQQKIFEWGLKQYPRGTDKRWDKIAEHIPGKSKEDCMARFKELAELVREKKKMDQEAKTS